MIAISEVRDEPELGIVCHIVSEVNRQPKTAIISCNLHYYNAAKALLQFARNSLEEAQFILVDFEDRPPDSSLN